MSISQSQLNHLSRLAALEIDPKDAPALQTDLNAIMNFVDVLRSVDTSGVEQLAHPLNVKQRLRQDTSETTNFVEELRALAPEFQDDLYLVPEVIP